MQEIGKFVVILGVFLVVVGRDSLAVPGSFRLGGQTPGRHLSAKGKFLFLFSGRHLHSGQHRSHALELVVPAVRRDVQACNDPAVSVHGQMLGAWRKA